MTNKLARGIKLLFLLIISSLIVSASHAQSVSDTTIVRDDANSKSKKNSFTSIFYGQPGKAALYSLVIPGAGQIYNKRWWKVPLVWAGEGFLVYNLTQKIDTFNEVDICRVGIVDNDPTLPCPVNSNGDPIATTSTEIFTIWQAARSQRDQAWIFLSAGHLINVFEAFVDRHLINFDVNENLTLSLQPDHYDYGDSGGSFQIPTTQIELFSLSISLNGSQNSSK